MKPRTWLTLAAVLLCSAVSAVGGAQDRETGEISVEEFMQSPAADFFQAGDYENAVTAIDSLMKKYPDDALLQRYKAMSLDRMGRSQDAIAIYRQILQKNPDHLPTKFFLGEAYERSGDFKAATEEWEAILVQDAGDPYHTWAEDALQRMGPLPVSEPSKSRRWNIAGRYGYEYDSNVILEPQEESLALARDQEGGRHILEISTKYRAMSRRDTVLDVLYAVRQSLHEDDLDDFDFMSHEPGLNLRHRTSLFGRDTILGARYDMLVGFLHSDLFSFKNRLTFSSDTRFTTRTRTIFLYRFTGSDYGPDGSDPERTSRDGLYHDVGVTQYWYGEDLKRYIFALAEFNAADTRGDNFESTGLTARIGVHVPVLENTELDAWGGVEYADYDDFVSLSSLDTNQRQDTDWQLYAALTHYLTKNIGIRGFYRFVYADNENGFFEYERHIGGVQVIFTESF